MGVMSVLSFSDIKYVGEQSRGTKMVEDILEDPTLVQVDYSRERADDHLSLAVSKEILMEVDCSRQVPNGDNLDDSHRMVGTLKEFNCAPLRSFEELPSDVHIAENPLSKIDEKVSNTFDECASFSKTYSSSLEGCNQSNVKEAVYRGFESFRGMNSQSDSKDKNKDICVRGLGVHGVGSLFESNNCGILTNGMTGGINKDKEVDVPCNADSVLINTPHTSAGSRATQSVLHKLPDLACRADSEHGDLLAHGEDYEYLSSGCISDQIMPSTECKHQNGNQDAGLQGTDSVAGGQVVHVIESLMESIPCDVDSILANASSTHAESGDIPSVLHMTPDLSTGCKQQDGSQDGESGLRGTESAENDYPVALWVKWRGKWKTGIQCHVADCPLTTLRAKPTHERKKYIAVFFPRSKTYSWVDVLLVRPIDESPEPLAYGSHRKWRKLVKDLTVPRHYIMQKLSVAMLNVSDQLHTEAVIENARKATTWKDYALESSRCRDYSELGRMLLKLQTMILQRYIIHDWLENSFDSWLQRCQSARSAESIEVLTEELVGSVTWNEVNELWNAPVQPELDPEWKTWKQEAMKYFFTSQSNASCRGIEKRGSQNSTGEGSQISRKRAKVEVYQSESCASLMEASSSRILPPLNMINGDSEHVICQNIMESTPSSELKLIHSPAVKISIDSESNKVATGDLHQEMGIMNKYQYRHCLAFVEAKGRNCGRWANDGDAYCCVHLNNHSLGKSSQEEQMLPIEASMCEGTTIHGRNCKHRAQLGSHFCKKHRLQKSHDSVHLLNSSRNNLKRKHAEDNFFEITSSSNFNNGEYGLVGENFDERNSLIKKSELCNALPTHAEGTIPDSQCCIGYQCQKNGEQCLEDAKLHTLYCEKHLPKFLKRARNGKSRIISKDVFTSFLRSCCSRKEKLYLHQACELLYGFMKSSLSQQKPVSKNDSIKWILSEASKDLDVGEFLLKLVSTEREKLTAFWGFDAAMGKHTSPMETDVVHMPERQEDRGNEMTVKCKICSEGFSDDKQLGAHWTEFHKKEGCWLFRGYACAVCMNSFTNREVLATHVKEKHGEPFLERSTLFRCMSCSSHFVNPEQLWQHALSSHPMEFRMPNVVQQHNTNTGNKIHTDIHEREDGSQRFKCRFCGLRFDLLPDLGRHHQAAHMNTISNTIAQSKRGNKNLKRTRHRLPGFGKNVTSNFTSKNRTGFDMSMHSKTAFSIRPKVQTQTSETVALGSLLRSHCSDVAEILFLQIQKTKPRPSNLDIFSIARSACCRVSLHAGLEVKFGKLPENLYLKAAKLCSELNIEVDWHLEGFICPKGCKPLINEHSFTPLLNLSDRFVGTLAPTIDSMSDPKWQMNESHYLLDPKHFSWEPRRKAHVLCEDVSFGKESVPVACVLDEDLKTSLQTKSDDASYQELDIPMPWHDFTYVTERLIAPSLGVDVKNPQLKCACPHPHCHPEKCDHVYLFDNDYENAEDIHGKPMRGRFPYADKGQIVLAEGYLVYECNSSCNCDSTCQNRVLQRGIQVKMEIFRTENKGWAVRAGEAISRGTFVCEYIGEVLSDLEGNKKGERYDSTGCSYLYDIDAHIDGAKDWSKQRVSCLIDATKYGNVSRFINHSCSPNLASYLVLVESMDCQLAHIGLYASRDIAAGEELAYDYRYELLPGDGRPCHCGAPNCRGRLY